MTALQLEEYRALLLDESDAERAIFRIRDRRASKDEIARVVAAYAATTAFEQRQGWTDDECAEAQSRLEL